MLSTKVTQLLDKVEDYLAAPSKTDTPVNPAHDAANALVRQGHHVHLVADHESWCLTDRCSNDPTR